MDRFDGLPQIILVCDVVAPEHVGRLVARIPDRRPHPEGHGDRFAGEDQSGQDHVDTFSRVALAKGENDAGEMQADADQ